MSCPGQKLPTGTKAALFRDEDRYVDDDCGLGSHPNETACHNRDVDATEMESSDTPEGHGVTKIHSPDQAMSFETPSHDPNSLLIGAVKQSTGNSLGSTRHEVSTAEPNNKQTGHCQSPRPSPSIGTGDPQCREMSSKKVRADSPDSERSSDLSSLEAELLGRDRTRRASPKPTDSKVIERRRRTQLGANRRARTSRPDADSVYRFVLSAWK